MTSHDLETIGQETIAVENVEVSAESARLIVQADTGDMHTRVLDLPNAAEVTFGRSRASTVHVDSESVSRTHARLRNKDGRIEILDLGSRNGTRVNGEIIDGPCVLSSGDEIRVGPSVSILSITSRLGRPVPLGTTTHLDERLAAEVDRGLRYRRSFGLVMLHLEGGEDACDAAVSRVARVARPMDVLVEYGADDLALLIPEADRKATADHATRLCEAARSGDVHVRAGAAVFPECGTHAHELLSRAREALRGARRDRCDDPVIASPNEAAVGSGAIVADPQMERVFELARRVADHSITVLVTGETGAGKEVVAEEIHRAGSRSKGPFAKLNCASIPETLLESELFGHERGAFTGADRRKSGHFEAADGGTVFLDEIGEISAAVQAKLLRVLEERKFTRVGSTEEIEVDVRVVCATNRDLEKEVAAGRFREDLFFRISAFSIIVPPLRDRPSEILPLAVHFLGEVAGDLGHPPPTLSPAAEAVLRAYSWPGNVRELRNAMERAVVMQTGGTIEPIDLPEVVRSARVAAAGAGSGGDVRDRVAEVERSAIVEALESSDGNQTHAAKKLGLSRRALIYKLEKYGLKKPPPSRR